MELINESERDDTNGCTWKLFLENGKYYHQFENGEYYRIKSMNISVINSIMIYLRPESMKYKLMNIFLLKKLEIGVEKEMEEEL